MIDKEYIELKEVSGSDWMGHCEAAKNIIEDAISKKDEEMLIKRQKTRPHLVEDIELDVLVNGVKPKNSKDRELALQNEMISEKRRQEFKREDSQRKYKESQKNFQHWRKNWQKLRVEIADFDFSQGEHGFNLESNHASTPIVSSRSHSDNHKTFLENRKISETIEMQSFDNLSENAYEQEESFEINSSHQDNAWSIEMKNLNNESNFNLDDKQQVESQI